MPQLKAAHELLFTSNADVPSKGGSKAPNLVQIWSTFEAF